MVSMGKYSKWEPTAMLPSAGVAVGSAARGASPTEGGEGRWHIMAAAHLQLVIFTMMIMMIISHVYVIAVLFFFTDDETLLVKLLIPSASAGIILGKGGETIICLQSQYCTNIKLSKAGDFFPGLLMHCF